MISILLTALLAAGAMTLPEPSLTNAEANIAYAVGAVCAPYVLEGASAESVMARRELVADNAQSSPIFRRLGTRPVRLGVAGSVHVGLSETPGRTCEVVARGADPQKLRSAVLHVMRDRRESFTPSLSRYLPGRFASEDRLCAAKSSRTPTAFFLASATKSAEHGHVAILVTLSVPSVRQTACDRPDARANYRTLIPPGAEDPSPPPPA